MSEFGRDPPDVYLRDGKGKIVGGMWCNPLAYYDDGTPRHFSLMEYKRAGCTAIDGRDPGDEDG